MTFDDPETEAFFRELESMDDSPTEAEDAAYVVRFLRELDTIDATPSVPFAETFADYLTALRRNAA